MGDRPGVDTWLETTPEGKTLIHYEVPVTVMVDDESDLPPLPEGRTRRFFTIEQLGYPRPIEWLVDGWIAAGELSVVFGQGDTYKSFLALHWALSAALEGREVVYIAAEGAHGMRARVPAWMRLHRKEASQLGSFRVDELPVIIDAEGERAMWLAEVEDEFKRKPDWVIVDTLAMCFGGEETNPTDMNRFVRGCEQIRRGSEGRTAVTVIHHMGVTTGRERGSAALRNATFSMAKVDNKRGLSARIACDRMKDAERPEAMRMKLRKMEWTNTRGEPVSSLAVEQTEPAKVMGKKRRTK